MTEKHSSSKEGGKRKNNKNAKLRKGHQTLAKDGSSENSSRMPHKSIEPQNFSKHHTRSTPEPSIIRKQVDPETANYFYKIANLFESNGIDMEERSVVCGNALEETRGKELELATDMIISRTIQTLLEGCDLDQLCSFLRSCAKQFSSIAKDKSGSYVAETALKSLAVHLQDQEADSVIEEILAKICKVVVVDSVNVMSSCYGSHVLRSLICFCKGVPLDALGEFHVTKSSAVLAERLNTKFPRSGGNYPQQLQLGFPDIFKFLVVEMLKHARDDIATLRVNKNSSFVLQTALKLLVGDQKELLHVILILLGCSEESSSQGVFIEDEKVQDIMDLCKDTASSHLLEAILEVAPENLYDEILAKVFRGSLFDISSHPCGNFVVQALVSSARSQGQVGLIWEELGTKLEELLEFGKSGVVASLLAACQRLEIHGHECCQVLAAAVCSESESPSFIVPHILFLESYFSCKEKSSWKWSVGDRMHTLGCLMLQTIFKFPSGFIQPYIKSIVSMEPDQVFETAKDAGGSRVLDSFFCSDASTKQKHKVVSKLRDHFGELLMHPSGSFTVEKCFNSGNLSLKEAIASEVIVVRVELLKTKHGPYLMKKLDIDGFAAHPEQWRSSKASKEIAYREFHATFGSKDSPAERKVPKQQLSHTSLKKQGKRGKKISEDADHGIDTPDLEFPGLESSIAKLGFSGFIRHGRKRGRIADAPAFTEGGAKKFVKNSSNTSFVRQSGERKSLVAELADLAGKERLSAGEVRKLFKSSASEEKNEAAMEKAPFLKKQKR